MSNWAICENKPNTNPIKANFRKAKMNVDLYVIKDYENVPELFELFCRHRASSHVIRPLCPAISTKILRFRNKVPAKNSRKYSIVSTKASQKEENKNKTQFIKEFENVLELI